jgi:hypothetical protein
MADQYLTKREFDEFLRVLKNGGYQMNHAPRHRAGGGDVLPDISGLRVEEQDASPTVTGVTRIKVTNGTLTDEGSGVISLSMTGSGAPTDPTYVTLSTNASLSNERVLTAGSGIAITDAGAGSTVTVAQTGRIMQTYIPFHSIASGFTTV